MKEEWTMFIQRIRRFLKAVRKKARFVGFMAVLGILVCALAAAPVRFTDAPAYFPRLSVADQPLTAACCYAMLASALLIVIAAVLSEGLLLRMLERSRVHTRKRRVLRDMQHHTRNVFLNHADSKSGTASPDETKSDEPESDFLDRKQWQVKRAVGKYRIIFPLLDENLGIAEKTALRETIAEQTGLSIRTIQRYESAYKTKDISGLLPKARGRGNKTVSYDRTKVLDAAIVFKREQPKRSVRNIIKILENNGYVAKGELKRPTLQRWMQDAGFSKRQMSLYLDNHKNNAARRYCKAHRMEMVQSDIKYGLYIPAAEGQTPTRAYLITMLDDHSKFPLVSRWYPDQEQKRVEDALLRMVKKYGKCDLLYVDNGSQYIAKHLRDICQHLGIKIRHAPVRQGKSKGKVERLHRLVDAFDDEVKLHSDKIKSIDDLNEHWEMYLATNYTDKFHEGIYEYYKSQGGVISQEEATPLREFRKDTRKLQPINSALIADAFLYREPRVVSKGATISLKGFLYGVDQSLVGCTVTVAYDPMNLDEVKIEYDDMKPMVARKVKIGPFVNPNEPIPEAMKSPEPTGQSSLLNALEKEYEEMKQAKADAVSYSDLFDEASSEQEAADHDKSNA